MHVCVDVRVCAWMRDEDVLLCMLVHLQSACVFSVLAHLCVCVCVCVFGNVRLHISNSRAVMHISLLSHHPSLTLLFSTSPSMALKSLNVFKSLIGLLNVFIVNSNCVCVSVCVCFGDDCGQELWVI